MVTALICFPCFHARTHTPSLFPSLLPPCTHAHTHSAYENAEELGKAPLREKRDSDDSNAALRHLTGLDRARSVRETISIFEQPHMFKIEEDNNNNNNRIKMKSRVRTQRDTQAKKKETKKEERTRTSEGKRESMTKRRRKNARRTIAEERQRHEERVKKEKKESKKKQGRQYLNACSKAASASVPRSQYSIRIHT